MSHCKWQMVSTMNFIKKAKSVLRQVVFITLLIPLPLYALDIIDILGGEELPPAGRKAPVQKNGANNPNLLGKTNNTQSSDVLDILGGEELSPLNKANISKESPYNEENKGKNQIDNVPVNRYGNPDCVECDLVKERGFESCMIAVLHLYTGEGFNFKLPREALESKGFSIYRWADTPPSPQELDAKLKQASQLWIISDQGKKLTDAHLQVIKLFFDTGKGVYIWGDNIPFYADANYVAEALLGTKMLGNTHGDQIVSLQTQQNQAGLISGHLITTGLQHLYEGITIATIQPSPTLKPLIYGSANNLVAATYDKYGKRAIIDGGFTRLYLKWDTAGTGRYVKNAAGWLVNYERLGKTNCQAQVK